MTDRPASPDPAALGILERQRIESEWYPPRRTKHFTDDASVAMDRELVDLPQLRKQGRIVFRFGMQAPERPAGLLPFLVRVAHAAGRRLRRWLDLGPGGAGLRTLRSRPEMIALLNEIARELARIQEDQEVPAIPLFVNSILRTIDHQRRLAALGYVAPLPSAHCAGYAADIEKAWYETRRPKTFALIARLLDRYRFAGVLNVIDEGEAWHICLHPLHREAYRKLFFDAAKPDAKNQSDPETRSHLRWLESNLAECAASL